MARRTRKKKSTASNPTPKIIGTTAAIILVGLGYWKLTSAKGTENSPRLPAMDLQNNPSSLKGSNFSVTGKVKEKMYHSESNGSIISIEVEDNSKIYMFPIIVPSGVTGPNLSAEQSYIFNGIVNSKERFIVSSYDDK